MKEIKLKKGLKIASVCGLAGVALLGFTGCATINDKEKDNLLSSIEKIDDVQASLDKINAEIDSVNYLAMKEKAWDVASGAIRKFKNEDSGIYDNLDFKYTMKDDTIDYTGAMKTFKDSNNNVVQILNEEEGDSWYYTDGNQDFLYETQISQGVQIAYKKVVYADASDIVFRAKSVYDWFEAWFDKDSVVGMEIIENGNKIINFAKDDIRIKYDQNEPNVIEERMDLIYELTMEIDTSGRIVNADIKSITIDYTNETTEVSYYTMEYNYDIDDLNNLKAEYETIKKLALKD